MLCYRNWKKTSGKPDEHIVVLKKAVKQAAELSKAILEEQIGLEVKDDKTQTNTTGADIKPQLDECLNEHFVNCPSTDPRPTIFR